MKLIFVTLFIAVTAFLVGSEDGKIVQRIKRRDDGRNSTTKSGDGGDTESIAARGKDSDSGSAKTDLTKTYIEHVLKKTVAVLTKAAEKNTSKDYEGALKLYLEAVGHLQAVKIALKYTKSYTEEQKAWFSERADEKCQSYLKRVDLLLKRLKLYGTDRKAGSFATEDEMEFKFFSPTRIGRFVSYVFFQITSKLVIFVKILKAFLTELPV